MLAPSAATVFKPLLTNEKAIVVRLILLPPLKRVDKKPVSASKAAISRKLIAIVTAPRPAFFK
jgi:hypothetical protein